MLVLITLLYFVYRVCQVSTCAQQMTKLHQISKLVKKLPPGTRMALLLDSLTGATRKELTGGEHVNQQSSLISDQLKSISLVVNGPVPCFAVFTTQVANAYSK